MASAAARLLTACAALLAATACSPPVEMPAEVATPPARSDPDASFTVTLTLSEAAARVVAVEHATLTVTAEWFGYPTVAAQQRQLVGGGDAWVSLHRDSRGIGGAGQVHFRSPVFDADRLALIEGRRAQLRIEVHDDSVGASLLDCGAFQDSLATAVRSGVAIDCRLAAE